MSTISTSYITFTKAISHFLAYGTKITSVQTDKHGFELLIAY